jgi:hypothetical protein
MKHVILEAVEEFGRRVVEVEEDATETVREEMNSSGFKDGGVARINWEMVKIRYIDRGDRATHAGVEMPLWVPAEAKRD